MMSLNTIAAAFGCSGEHGHRSLSCDEHLGSRGGVGTLVMRLEEREEYRIDGMRGQQQLIARSTAAVLVRLPRDVVVTRSPGATQVAVTASSRLQQAHASAHPAQNRPL